MKRGLKHRLTGRPTVGRVVVQGPSPMKRGLKPSTGLNAPQMQLGPRAFPDEEGIETRVLSFSVVSHALGPRAFPDEEGIETWLGASPYALSLKSKGLPR